MTIKEGLALYLMNFDFEERTSQWRPGERELVKYIGEKTGLIEQDAPENVFLIWDKLWRAAHDTR